MGGGSLPSAPASTTVSTPSSSRVPVLNEYRTPSSARACAKPPRDDRAAATTSPPSALPVASVARIAPLATFTMCRQGARVATTTTPGSVGWGSTATTGASGAPARAVAARGGTTARPASPVLASHVRRVPSADPVTSVPPSGV